jgi:hypothetical protein
MRRPPYLGTNLRSSFRTTPAVSPGPTSDLWQTGAVAWAKLAPPLGTADANQRRGPGGEALLANRLAASIAYFVYAGIDFPQGRVNSAEMLTLPRDERRNVLPLEGDRGALRVMLVVAPGRALARAGDDRGELPLQLSDSVKRLVAIGIQPEPGLLRVSHLRRLSLKETIPSAGEQMSRLVPAM